MNLFVLSPDFSCAISEIITVAIAHNAWAHFFQMARLLGKFIPKSTTLEQRAISRLLRMRAFKTVLNALHISAFLRFTSQATQVSIPLTEPITFCRPGYNCFCLVWTVRFYTHKKSTGWKVKASNQYKPAKIPSTDCRRRKKSVDYVIYSHHK